MVKPCPFRCRNVRVTSGHRKVRTGARRWHQAPLIDQPHQFWSLDEIIDGIEAIANEPTNDPTGIIPVAGPRVKIRGLINGHPATVIVDPAGAQVVTAYPIGVAPQS